MNSEKKISPSLNQPHVDSFPTPLLKSKNNLFLASQTR